MTTIVFKTTLKCADCVETVRPFIDAVIGEGNWTADIEHPDKLVTISVEDPGHTLLVQGAFERAGYRAEVSTPE